MLPQRLSLQLGSSPHWPYTELVTESHSYPQWKGFERSPEGLLLRQLVELDEAMGIAYERSVGFFKDMHTHSRLMVVAPRGACRMTVRTPEPSEFPVDSRTVLLVPAHLLHDDLGTSVVYDTMALYPSEELLNTIATECGLSAEQARALTSELRILRRSPWLEDILERYFCERVLDIPSAEGSKALLEKQILHEIVRIAFDLAPALADATMSADAAGDTIGRALVFIEGNLFEPLDVTRLCAATRTSESTLLRAFKREVGQTPSSYVRQRRLDEAARLLAAGDHKVGDVALLIGYEDIGAFARAFKDRFGVSPRDYGRDVAP